ncbi:hypothetical protein [Rhodoferax sp.]|uniref:hypothetical protein n=1 Tax=Rhodoferax sp. TaxID=50421 RepID=UPI0025CF753E|nr:hypothetical protein [Rhodoferax sp.]
MSDRQFSPIPGTVLSAEQQQKLRLELASSGKFSEFIDMAQPLEHALFSSASSLYEFFHANGYMILRTDWEQTHVPNVPRSYLGWVYAFYTIEDFPLYIGETGRTFAARFDEHEKDGQPWWPDWHAVKVLPCPTQSIRKIFESLIGLAGGYAANKMQPVGVDNLLDEVVYSLLLLGNKEKCPPIFPTISPPLI